MYSAPAKETNDYYYPVLPNDTAKRPCSFNPVLHTNRLTLTILDPDDPDDMQWSLDFFNDPGIMATVGDTGIRNLEQLEAYHISTSLLPQHTPFNKPPTGPSRWLVRLGTGQRIGMMIMGSRDERVPPDIGWGLLPSHQNHGYASEAAVRVRDYFLDEFQGGFRNQNPPISITAIISNTKNVRSMGVARRLGLVRSGEVSICNSEGRTTPVFVIPGLGMEVFTPDLEINIYGHGEAGKRTLNLLAGVVKIGDEKAAKLDHTEVALEAGF